MTRNEEVYRAHLDFGSLVKGGRVVPHWFSDGARFWYAKEGQGTRELIRVDPRTNTTEPLFDPARLRAALGEQLGYELPARGLPFEDFELQTDDRVVFTLDGRRFALRLDTYELSHFTPLSDHAYADLVPSEVERHKPRTFTRWKLYATGRRESSPEALSPDGRWILSIQRDNVVLRAVVDGHEVTLTHDGTPRTFWDMDATLWCPWSPDSVRFAVLKQHTEGMARIPTIEWLKPREQTREVIALPAGGALCRSELHLFDIYSQRSLAVTLDDTADQYLRVLTWRPDGSELILARYNRPLCEVVVQAADVRTGAVRTLLSERSETFLTHHHQVLWGNETGLTVLADGSGFIWCSERSGWRHLYAYDFAGRLVRQLTSGEWRVQEVVRAESAGGWVYFTGQGDHDRPYDTHLYRVRMDGSGLRQLTQDKGQHRVSMAPSGQYFTDTRSAVDTPPRTVLCAVDGTVLRTLDVADIERLDAVGWAPPRECVVKAADGVSDLWATLYLPYDFRPEARYPVVEYIYGGPQSVARPVDFGDRATAAACAREENFNRALANLGFVVVILDGRGTPGRSKAFQDVVYRNFGRFEIADHAGALRQLGERLPFLDLDRVAVWGWSWGGQFAFRALTQAPDVYKAGICGWPAFDPQRLMLYEAYLGLPQENPAGYRAADTFELAPQLTGELLLVGGMNDPSTQADLFKMSEALIRLGKQHRIMVYPSCGHGAVGKTAEYDLELKKRFFTELLLQREKFPAASNPCTP